MGLAITGKVALVFGGSKGIGPGCAQEFARAGFITRVSSQAKFP